MREILFRGKDIAGNWHYGFPMIFNKTFAILNKPFEHSKSIEIETLGQYTGLCDKHGKEIFEGDIVKCVTEDTNQTRFAVIKYGKYKDENFEDSCLGFYIEFKGQQFSMFNGEADGCDLLSVVEVVDNIHDNPELLEE